MNQMQKLLELIDQYAEARRIQGHSNYSFNTAAARREVEDELERVSLSANAGEPRNAIDRDALIDAIAQGLHGTWHCTRVWEAWHVGTMSQDDFEPVDESETPTEIADAVLALLAAPPTAQAEGWRPIETAPKDGALIVLGARNGVWLGKYVPVYQSGYRPENPWSSMLLNHDHMAERYTRPTHWMPLPPPPTSAEGVEHG